MKKSLKFKNLLFGKKEIKDLVSSTFSNYGKTKTTYLIDDLKDLGFNYATKAGISISVEDLKVPPTKQQILKSAFKDINHSDLQYERGEINSVERFQKVLETWNNSGDNLKKKLINYFAETDPLNSIFIMAFSGARGNVSQVRQLVGMRGLMSDPNGQIIDIPIINNFREGLTITDYIMSSYGARKGVVDTALRTADSGYLTRRLVDVAQDCIVRIDDCGTKRSIKATASIHDGEVVATIAERVLGRVAAEDVLDPATQELLCKNGQMIDERIAEAIEDAALLAVQIRSPLTCESDDGVCAQCYGRDLARGSRVNQGEAVGIIAAQSIGEPGTQLTMRTFHIGGIAQGASQSFMEASQSGKVDLRNANLIKNSDGDQIVMGRNMELAIIDEFGVERAAHKLGYGSKLHVKKGQKVDRGHKLFEWDPYTLPIIAEKSGVAKFVDLVAGIALREDTDDATGISQRIVTDWRSAPKGNDLKPEIVIIDPESGNPVVLDNGNPEIHSMSVDAILSVEDGALVKPGDVIARIPREGAKTKDITGGLPRVAELFEARRPKDHAIIAEIDGHVHFGKDYKNKRRITIDPSDKTLEPIEYMVPKGKHIPVQEGDFIRKGEYIMDGNPAPHDILSIMGVEALAVYMIDEVQEVYRLQGVKINDKHIEVIVRQMLQKWEVTDSGGTTLLKGEQIDKIEFEEANLKAIANGREPAKGGPILLGITKASLQTRSFISAASFQETTRVLTEAATQGKRDKLIGLKENVIVGRLIPAGTGGAARDTRRIAAARDAEIIAAKEEKAAIEMAEAQPEPQDEVESEPSG